MRLRITYLYCLLGLLVLAPVQFMGQSCFWLETFSASSCNQGCLLPFTGPNGTWTWVSTGVNGASANTWYVSYQEKPQGRTVCGAAGPPASLHVGNVSTSPAAFLFCPTGDCGAAYDAGIGTGVVVANARATSPVINCTGQNTITLSFNYILNGQNAKDYITVWYYNGAIWALLATPPRTTLCGAQGKWAHYTVALPASANNNANVQIGFNWINNDDGAGNDPSFAVDSVCLSAPAALPVELMDFKADYDNNHDVVNLQWLTASETNNALFTVQRSADGESFADVFSQKGAGSSSQTIYYNGVDETILGGTVYYRLKQTDYDGQYTYSAIVPVNENDPTRIRIYPDPVTSYINAGLYMYAGETGNLKVYDCAGRLMSAQNIVASLSGENTFKLDVTTLAKGVYILKMDLPGKSFFNRFVKQ